MEGIIEEEEGDSAVVDALYLEAAIDDNDAAENEKALKSTNGVACYSSLSMVTGVKVEKYMRLCKIHTTNQSSRRNQSKKHDEEAHEEMTAQKSLLVKGIWCLVKESFTTF